MKSAGIALGILTIIVAVVAQVLGEIQGTQTPASSEYNITGQGLTAQTQLASFLTVIAVVVAAVVIIALVSRGMGGGSL